MGQVKSAAARRAQARSNYRGWVNLLRAALINPQYHTPGKLAIWTRRMVQAGVQAGVIRRALLKG